MGSECRRNVEKPAEAGENGAGEMDEAAGGPRLEGRLSQGGEAFRMTGRQEERYIRRGTVWWCRSAERMAEK